MKLTGLLLAGLLIFSCNERSNDNKESVSAKEPLRTDGAASTAFKAGDENYTLITNEFADMTDTVRQQGMSITTKKKQAVDTKMDWDKRIIKNANLQLEVKNYDSYYRSIREKVRSLGGYVAQEEQKQSDSRVENTIEIKVPVDQFDDALSKLTAEAIKIETRNISSQDVTGEMVDTRARMEAKKQVRLRYMDLLGQAKNMPDILSVQGEINGIQEEIESAEGRIQYLGHSSTFSTIHLNCYQLLNPGAVENKDPNFGQKLISSLGAGWTVVVELIIGLVAIWPLLLLAAAIILIYRRFSGTKRVA